MTAMLLARRKRLLWLALIALWLLPAAVQACPGCKEAAFSTPAEAEQGIASSKAYAFSIYLLLAVPAVLVGGTAVFVFKASRQRDGN